MYGEMHSGKYVEELKFAAANKIISYSHNNGESTFIWIGCGQSLKGILDVRS